MSRRDNADRRCAACRMHLGLCVCALVPRLVTRTRLVLILHKLEERKTTNTGQLAARALVNSEIVVRGREGEADRPIAVPAGAQPVLLYPAEDAVPLATFASTASPVVLAVPDGNWRQAAKARKRVPGLDRVPCATLPQGDTTAYRLRFEPQKGGLATIEAIARAFAILEGAEVAERMLVPFRAMVERTLWSRGVIDASQVAGGLPAGAVRHDPTSGATR